jgi:hypothetical protein
MALTVEPPPVQGVDAGVIDDARRRQHRHRRYGVVLGLAVAIAGPLAYLAFDASGGRARSSSSQSAAAGSVRPVDPSAVPFFATPLLDAGNVQMSVQGNRAAYPGAGAPVTMALGGFTSYVPVNGDPDVLLFVAPDVAAVRIGKLGTIKARYGPGLPGGDKVVAFALPQHGPAKAFLRTTGPLGRPKVTALDSQGHPIPRSRWLGEQGGAPFPYSGPRTRHGACALGGTAPGLVTRASWAVSLPTVEPSALPGPFLSCFDTTYTYKGAYYALAILVNAKAPGQPPAALWASHRVPGHPGVVEMTPPRGVSAQTSPLLGRRDRNAWLVEIAEQAFHRTPNLAQRIAVLAALHTTRLNLRRT